MICSLVLATMLFASPVTAQGASAPGMDVVVLKSGSRVEGTVIKRSDRRVWVDVGPDVIVFEMEDVTEVLEGAAEGPSRVVADDLFRHAVDPPQLSPKEHAKRIGPAVIKVSTPGGLGSGVIISPEGYAITNAHVVQGESAIRCTVWFPQPDGTLKRTEVDDVEIVGVNNHLDLALLKMEHPENGSFEAAPIVKEEKFEIGQQVFAIGNPLGLERTLTQGVISTTQRDFDGLTYIQTDTPINPGNSGGPLFNTSGEVIGITNMGIRGGEALGFAIPSRYVKDFVRNREAFAYDHRNPNSGHNYHQPPTRADFTPPPEVRDGSSATP
ncbi:MAG: trypsin-like peptidase domain-containing protein [Planctomycetota bacterium]|nr:trypsin-like peptidase domain-containing protein [Planctomycetota bacterium]MDA1105783.1 trypsin-like peptidase domain-containing protein [Planctomycetota bacterium]